MFCFLENKSLFLKNNSSTSNPRMCLHVQMVLPKEKKKKRPKLDQFVLYPVSLNSVASLFPKFICSVVRLSNNHMCLLYQINSNINYTLESIWLPFLFTHCVKIDWGRLVREIGLLLLHFPNNLRVREFTERFPTILKLDYKEEIFIGLSLPSTFTDSVI